MRLKSAIWVAAYVRRMNGMGAFAAVVRRGAEDAGAVFVKVNRLDGTVLLFGPAPQSLFADAQPSDRLFTPLGDPQGIKESEADSRLEREASFDPDLWVVEIEDREGRHFLDLAKE